MNFNKSGKVFTSKFVGTGPSSYKKKNLLGHGLIKVENHCVKGLLRKGISHRPLSSGLGF
jgi:hypothetical protein